MYLILHKEFWECGTTSFSLLQVNVKLRLPVVFNKFLQPISMSVDDFFPQWRALAGPPMKLQEVVCICNICGGYSSMEIHLFKISSLCVYVAWAKIKEIYCLEYFGSYFSKYIGVSCTKCFLKFIVLMTLRLYTP